MEVPEAEGTYLCPAIDSAMLKPFSQRINRCVMSIVDTGDVAMEMKGKLQTGNPDTSGVEVTKELIYISSDGKKIQVYQNTEGVHCFGGVPLSGPYREYAYPNLPARLWKKYLHAYKFVEVVKSKTSKIVLITDKAKCKLMENASVPDFEAHFHDGVRILLSKAKIHVTESHGGTMVLDAGCLKDRVTERTMQMIEYTILCQAECHQIHDSLIAVQARDDLINVFPVTIGSIHNPFLISQQSCQSGPAVGAKQGGRTQHFYQESKTSQFECDFHSHFAVPRGDNLKSPSSPLNTPLETGENVSKSHVSQATQNTDICSYDLESNSENQTNHLPSLHVSPCKEKSHQSHFTFIHSRWPSGVELRQDSYTTSHRVNSAGDAVQENSNVLIGQPEDSDIGMWKQEMCESFKPELDVSHQSDSSVPFPLSCQCENTTPFPPCFSGKKFSTPTKCQTRSNASQKRCYSEGCSRTKSLTRDLVLPHMENAFQSPSVKRNLFADGVIEDSMTSTTFPDSLKSLWQELKKAPPPDILGNYYKETSLNVMPKVSENEDSNTYKQTQQMHMPLQQQDIFSDSIDKRKPFQHPSMDSGVGLDPSEMTQVNHKFENLCCTSEVTETLCGVEEGKVLECSSNSITQHRHGCVSKEVLTTSGNLIQNSNLLQSESNLASFYTKSNSVHPHPPQCTSPKKLSRKVASSSAPSPNLKYDIFDLATIEENQQVSTVSDKSFSDLERKRENFIEPGSGNDFSCTKLNASLPNSLGIRKGANLKNFQEKLNTSLPQCMSPSHSRTVPTFPLSPQKEFLQGGRECQSTDSTLPPQVRNSLDMSISSYYSDSPSSSPSSGCDPIYQVFVPYTGWASYYAGGAIWVLYNDGTQLGVKASEAVMTFIDQDGTQKKFKNNDVVPDIVKMKLEKLPNVLRTVMKNKDSEKTS